MNIAKCILDGKVYSAQKFSELPPNEMSSKRKRLICPECGVPVFFRKASRSGQAACFGALPHAEGCIFATVKTQEWKIKGIEGAVGFSQDGKLGIDVDYIISKSKLLLGQMRNHDEGQIQASKALVVDAKKNTDVSIQLSMLLTSLVGLLDFRSFNEIIKPERNPSSAISDFFVNFKDVDSVSDEEVHGYWGVLSDARLGSDGSLWLNSGSVGDVSCVVPADMVDVFYKRYELEDEEDIAGAYVIVIGIKKVSQAGKKYVVALDVDYLAISPVGFVDDLKNRFFLNEKKRVAFFIKNNDKGFFDDQLGIKKKHYLDKSVAKEWRAKLVSEYHPDKNQGDETLDYDEILTFINKMYSRMVGKA
jgi:hypothetical protein